MYFPNLCALFTLLFPEDLFVSHHYDNKIDNPGPYDTVYAMIQSMVIR